LKNTLKKIEFYLKNFLYQVLFQALFRNKPYSGTVDIKSISRILIIKRDHFGDMIVTSVLFKMLKDLYPQIEIDLLTNQKGGLVARFDSHLSYVLTYDQGVWNFVKMFMNSRRRKYDMVMGISFSGITIDGFFANLLAPEAIKAAIYLRKPHQLYSVLFNLQIDIGKDDTLIPAWRQLWLFAQKVFDVRYDEEKLKAYFELPPSAKLKAATFLNLNSLKPNSYFSFNLSSRKEYCQWGLENQLALLRHFQTVHPHRKILITFSPQDKAQALKLLNELQDSNIVLQDETIGLYELSVLIEHAAMLISPDTANIHLAALYGTPTLILATPVNTTPEWIPLHGNCKYVFTDGDHPLQTLSPKKVIDAFEQFRKEISTST
jgi:heptosyltransferase III